MTRREQLKQYLEQPTYWDNPRVQSVMREELVDLWAILDAVTDDDASVDRLTIALDAYDEGQGG